MNLFDDGEVLGAIATCLIVILPMVAQVAWEKWRGDKSTHSKTQGGN